MDGLSFSCSIFECLELLLNFFGREGIGGFEGVLDWIMGIIDAIHLTGNGFLFLGNPFLEGLKLFFQDSRRSGFHFLTYSFPAISNLLIGTVAFLFGLPDEDLFGEFTKLVEPIFERLRENFFIIVIVFITSLSSLCFRLFGDCLGFASHLSR